MTIIHTGRRGGLAVALFAALLLAGCGGGGTGEKTGTGVDRAQAEAAREQALRIARETNANRVRGERARLAAGAR